MFPFCFDYNLIYITLSITTRTSFEENHPQATFLPSEVITSLYKYSITDIDIFIYSVSNCYNTRNKNNSKSDFI